MKHSTKGLTRRDFIKAAGCTAMGVAMGLPAAASEDSGEIAVSKVVLIRNKDAVGAGGEINGEIIREMLDQAVMALFGKDDPV
ncbi:MAG: twin-arginine translocation signal domain-containing protein, partial [Candidatus Zixiibacteriota bacterium]